MRSQEASFLAFGKDLFTYGILEGIARMISFLLLPIFTRVFATDQFGALDIIVTMTSLLSTLASMSLPSAINRYYNSYGSEKRPVLHTTLLLAVTLVSVLLFGTGWLLSDYLAVLLIGTRDFSGFIVLGFLAASFTAISWVPQALLRMDRQIVRYNILNILYALLYAGSALLFVFQFSLGLAGVFWGAVLASFIQVLLSLYWTRNNIAPRISAAYLVRSLRYSLPLVPSVMVNWVNKQSDRLVLLFFIGLSAVGIFAAATRIATVIELFLTIFRRSWTPYSMRLLETESETRDQFYAQSLLYFLAGFFVLALFFSSIAPEFFALIVSGEFAIGIVIVPWVMGGLILHFAGHIASMGILIDEKTHLIPIASWTGAILNVVLAIILIRTFGLPGAAVGQFLASLIKGILLLMFSHRSSSIRFNTSKLFVILSIYSLASGTLLTIFSMDISPVLSFLFRISVPLISSGLLGYLVLDAKAIAALRALSARYLRRTS
ncbi:MAG: hypothetical protein DWQ07_08960 [Chloroflexi bacterium]|nr:MAG: hypothetical protein DWQ07_08960 [Chloroflexota bacterium]MBL1193158.1 hypothetical protein [Chloroflexota bacterium]NOH10451.1 oligosaccharide flippase family protein [Chloroflexota bacterium]